MSEFSISISFPSQYPKISFSPRIKIRLPSFICDFTPIQDPLVLTDPANEMHHHREFFLVAFQQPILAGHKFYQSLSDLGGRNNSHLPWPNLLTSHPQKQNLTKYRSYVREKMQDYLERKKSSYFWPQ